MDLKPCPFCGSKNVDPAGWASTDRSGPACDDCNGSADTVELWNARPLDVCVTPAMQEAAWQILTCREGPNVTTRNPRSIGSVEVKRAVEAALRARNEA